MNKKRVLFVDDEIEVLNSLERQMKSEIQFVSIFESDPLKVIDVITNNPVDIIVADIVMPNLDGISLLHQLKEKFPNIMRIMLTAHGDYETSMRAINEADVFGFITKPWSKDYLIGHIRMAAKVLENLRESNGEKFTVSKPQIIITELSDKNGIRPIKFTTGLSQVQLEQVISRVFMSLTGFVEPSERFNQTLYSIPLNDQGLAARGYLSIMDDEKDLPFGVFIIMNSNEFDSLGNYDALLQKIAEKVQNDERLDLEEMLKSYN